MRKTTPNASVSTPCNDVAFLERYLNDQLDEAEELRTQQHVSSCEECRRALKHAAGDESLWNEVSELLVPVASEDDSPYESSNQLLELKEYLAPTDDPHMLGRLGHYEVQALIGRGSTGIVLKALEKRLNRYVAIKLMSPVYRSNGAARRRFEREGRAVAAVSHDHVVPIYGVDEFNGLPYIVMKYIPGLSLQQRIDRDGPLDTCEVMRVGMQVASALAAAHAQGIVHRDVKPANVILEDTVDRAMVTDFGLARVADEMSMTHSGTITGTPQYMSPEQARGDSVDLHSDLFSLGSLLYAACTAHPPFRAQTLVGVIHRVCETEPRAIRELNPEIDETLVDFISKLMSKRVADRFASASEVALVLENELAYRQNPTVAAKPVRDWAPESKKTAAENRPRKKRTAIGVAIGAVLVATGFAIFDKNKPDSVRAHHASILAGMSGVVSQDPANMLPAGAVVSWKHHPTKSATGEWNVYEQVIEHSLPVKSGGKLTMRVDSGDVQLVVGDGTVAKVHITRRIAAEGPQQAGQFAQIRNLEVIPDGDGMMLIATNASSGQSEGDPSGILEVFYRIEIPQEFNPDIDTAKGSISVPALTGKVNAVAQGGDIRLGHIQGPVFAESRNGNIDLTEGCTEAADLMAIRGDVRVAKVLKDARARTSGGDIWLGANPGRVYAQTSGGSIFVSELEGPTGGFSEHGDVQVKVPNSPPENCRFIANDGNVILQVADDVAVDIQARGAVESVFELENAVAEDDTGTWSGISLNGGGARVRLETGVDAVMIERLPETQDVAAFREKPSVGGVSPKKSGVAGLGNNGSKGSGLGGSGSGGSGSKGSGLGGSGLGGSGLGGSGLGGSGLGGSGLGGSGLGGSGLGGSGLGGSGLGGSGSKGSGLGGSGSGGSASGGSVPNALLSGKGVGRITDHPGPGLLANVELPESGSMMDGYSLYLPISHDTHEGKYPVLVFLQGGYGVGGEIDRINHWGLPRLLRDETDMTTERNQMLLDGFIVVSPHIQDGNYYDYPDVLRSILDQIFATYKADESRVYMTGLSRGGGGSWGLASRLPGTFAAIAPVGGNAWSVGDQWDALSGTAIWVSHNKHDGVIPFEKSAEAMQNLEQHFGIDFRRFDTLDVSGTDYLDHRYILTSAPTDSHDAWTDLYSNVEFYRWLLRHRSNAE